MDAVYPRRRGQSDATASMTWADLRIDQ